MIEQIAIGLLGPTAVWLANDPRLRWRRWGCIVGMVSQPFWYIAVWKASQWGVACASVVYTAAWLRGIHTYWLRRV